MPRIGQLAAEAGLRPSAIRYYESIGLLPHPDRVSGRRVYPEAAAYRLEAIALAKAAGLSLAQTREALSATGLGATVNWQRAVHERKSALAQERARLALMQKVLSGIGRCGCATAEECGRRFRVARLRRQRG